MTFNSTDPKSRYTMFGINSVINNSIISTTSVGNRAWDTFISTVDNNYQYKIGKIPLGYEHRPDLISNLFYNSPGYWWLLMAVNGVVDPFDGFNVNDLIKLPILK
jgi:hypothetical protein